MSNNQHRLKRYIFDSCFFTYTLSLVVYCGFLVAGFFGASAELSSQDNAVAHMGPIVWSIIICMVVMAGATLVLASNRRTTLGEMLFASPLRRQEIADIPFFKSFWGLHMTLTFLLSLLVSLKMTEFSLNELTDPDGFAGAMRLYHGMTHANLALLPTAIVQVIETIYIAFLATVIAIPFSFVMAFCSAKNIMKGHWAFAVYAVLRTYLNITRSVEPLIWALIFTVWVGVGPFAGMLALMVHSVASVAKQFSEIIEDVNEGPMEAIRATGAGPVQVVWFGIVPQVVMPFISFVIYRWDTNVRMATVIGLVGGGGIGNLLIKYQGQAMWPEVGCIIMVIAAAVWIMDLATAYIREALR